MASGGRREEINAKIKGWERELERVRITLARAPEAVHTAYYPDFVDLYRQKELLRSAWEAVRGVYQPGAEAIHRFEQALAAMETAWEATWPKLANLFKAEAA